MAKKNKEEVIVTETPVETTPTTAEELSPLIVSLQSELNSVQEQIRASRADFVAQTDKQFAKIAELDSVIASKQAKVEEYTNIADVLLPEAQKAYSDTRNKAGVLMAQAETSLKEVEKREETLARATNELARQKIAQDEKEEALNSLSVTLDARSKELDERDKATEGLKKALGLK